MGQPDAERWLLQEHGEMQQNAAGPARQPLLGRRDVVEGGAAAAAGDGSGGRTTVPVQSLLEHG